MGNFSSLTTNTASATAKEIHDIIRIHPAFSYIRTAALYDALYLNFKANTDNLSEARVRAALHILHILDETAHSLGIIDTNIWTKLPEIIFHDAFSNPKYKANSDKVTPESKLRQQQRLRQQQLQQQSQAQAATKDLSNIAFSWTVTKSANIDELVKEIKTGNDANRGK